MDAEARRRAEEAMRHCDHQECWAVCRKCLADAVAQAGRERDERESERITYWRELADQKDDEIARLTEALAHEKEKIVIADEAALQMEEEIARLKALVAQHVHPGGLAYDAKCPGCVEAEALRREEIIGLNFKCLHHPGQSADICSQCYPR